MQAALSQVSAEIRVDFSSRRLYPELRSAVEIDRRTRRSCRSAGRPRAMDGRRRSSERGSLSSAAMRRRALLLAVLALAAAAAACGGRSGDLADRGNRPTPTVGATGGQGDAAGDLGFPAFATKNTTRVGGADPVADAAGIARAVFPGPSVKTRPGAVALVDARDWRGRGAPPPPPGPPVPPPPLPPHRPGPPPAGGGPRRAPPP